jgi:hypothetical protein
MLLQSNRLCKKRMLTARLELYLRRSSLQTTCSETDEQVLQLYCTLPTITKQPQLPICAISRARLLPKRWNIAIAMLTHACTVYDNTEFCSGLREGKKGGGKKMRAPGLVVWAFAAGVIESGLHLLLISPAAPCLHCCA